VTASECWAVGYYDAGNSIVGPIYQTLIEHWNGTAWAIVTSLNTGGATQNNYLSGVTCVTASECWAVGYYDAGNSTVGAIYQTLIEHWNGTAWAIVVSPNVNGRVPQNNVLNGVTCVAASECWAVGYYYTGITYQTLLERWDGTSWAMVSSPNTSATQANLLSGVTCVAASNCWAVGDYFNGIALQTLIEHWDGTLWSIVTSPNSSTAQTNVLSGVTCLSASDCWAVGHYAANGGTLLTLTEHYPVPPVQLISVASRKTHDSAGTFDVDLPLMGPRGIECRNGGTKGDYTLVFTFATTLTSVGGANVTSGAGSVTSDNIDSSDARNYIVNLTGVSNAQYITVSLTNVTDSAGNFSIAVSASMGVLLGDVNASGLVDGNDVSSVQSQTRQSVNSTNFRYDVNTSGLIDGNDVSITQGQTRTSLPGGH
jgi:hypothetical protein